MKIFFKNISILLLSFLFFSNYALSDNTYFIDFTKVLNNSKAGSEAQKKLKDKYTSESKKFLQEEEKIKKEETEIIAQRKILSNEDYQKKVNELRTKVANLQDNKQKSLNSIAKSRNEAKQILLKSVNPILKKYMQDNGIRIVLEKESVILGDTTLELTDIIIELLNKELTSIKFE